MDGSNLYRRLPGGVALAAGVLYAIGTALIWALIPFWIRTALGFVDPVSMSALRLLGGGLIFALIARDRTPVFRLLQSRQTRRWVAIGAGALALNHILFAAGLQWTTPTAGVISVQIQTVAASALSWIVLGEAISLHKGAGMAAVIGGIVIVGWDGQDLSQILGSERSLGNLVMFAGGLLWGIYAVCQRRFSSPRTTGEGGAFPGYNPQDLLAPFFLLAGVFAVPVVAPFAALRAPVSLPAVATLAALTVAGTVGGYYCLSQAMNRLPVATAVTITNTAPLIVALISIVVYGEALSIYTVAGGALAVAGCAAAVRADAAQSPVATGATPGR